MGTAVGKARTKMWQAMSWQTSEFEVHSYAFWPEKNVATRTNLIDQLRELGARCQGVCNLKLGPAVDVDLDYHKVVFTDSLREHSQKAAFRGQVLARNRLFFGQLFDVRVVKPDSVPQERRYCRPPVIRFQLAALKRVDVVEVDAVLAVEIVE